MSSTAAHRSNSKVNIKERETKETKALDFPALETSFIAFSLIFLAASDEEALPANLRAGKEIHGYSVAMGFEEDVYEKYGIVPRLEHYACMVDLLGRAGKIDEAYGIVQRMPIEADLFGWGALLGACRQHNCLDLA
ncbi:hypothetical protein ACS0TY_019313 [Phlomoides rotata]